MWTKFSNLQDPVSFEGAKSLVPILQRVLRGWTMTEVKPGQGQPKIHLTAGARGFERRSPWIEGGGSVAFMDPVDAVCDLLLDLERAYIEDSNNLLVLHAAGVQIGANEKSGLVVFPATHAAGKSLLTTALAYSGCRVFSDDQLPIMPGKITTAMAPGFLPRLRRPLPEGLNKDFVDFIEAHTGPTSQNFRYVDLPKDRLAPVTEQLPIVGIVLLNRAPQASPKIEPVGEADVLKACVLQSFGRTLGAMERLDHLHTMVKSADCVKITYASVHQAQSLLQERFK